MKKALSLLVAAALLLTLGCGTAKPPAPKSAPKPSTLRITYVKAPLNIPSIVEKKQQLFEKEFGKDNIKIEYPEITSGAKQTEALAAGSLEFLNALGGTSAILAAANGVDVKVIGVYSRAPKAFTILAMNPEIKSAADLKGKKVAGPKGTILHQVLLSALEQNGLSSNDVAFANMDLPQAVSALVAGHVDAALVAGPAVLKAAEAGARVIATGEGLVDGIIVIAASDKFIKAQPDLVNRFLAVHNASLKVIKDNPEEAYRLTAEETGLTLDQVKAMAGWYDFDPTIRPADIKELEKTQDFLIASKLLDKKIDISTMIANVGK